MRRKEEDISLTILVSCDVFAKIDKIPLLITEKLAPPVLSNVHGSRLQGQYKLRRTLAKLNGRYWWRGIVEDTVKHIDSCLQCTVAEDIQHGRQAPLEVKHPEEIFEQIASDVQTITPRAFRDNIMVLSRIDFFTRFVRARALPDEKAKLLRKY